MTKWLGLERRSVRRLRRLNGSTGRPTAGWATLVAPIVRQPRRSIVLAAVLAAVGSLPVGGPVAAVAAACYAGLAVALLGRRHRARSAAEAIAAALDAVTGLAADLRAGLAPATALAIASPALESSTVDEVRRAAEWVSGAWQVAQVAGVPLADLLDRLDTDVRGLRRVRAGAAAAAAGAEVTAWLLAALPVGGIGLGYGIGADPLRVLLHTPVGAVCALLAVALQLAGLAWSDRLARAIAEAC